MSTVGRAVFQDDFTALPTGFVHATVFNRENSRAQCFPAARA
jgi:hypothetical protein